MTTFVHRYETDTSRPSVGQVARDLGLRALLPAVVLWCLVTGAGYLVVGPLGDLPAGDGVEQWFADGREVTSNSLSELVSLLGSTNLVTGLALVTVALLWWRSRQWWFALVPALAVALQSLVFIASSALVGRDRPDVEQLDDAPPTSSFPSGHTGASAALWFTLAMLAQRIRNPVLRSTATVVCLLVPFAVGTSRLYRGMHGPADVVVGLLNGAVCTALAWGYLRRTVPASGSRRRMR